MAYFGLDTDPASGRGSVKVSGKKFFTTKDSIERKKFLPGTRRA
jgi:hypothetical protein